MNIFKGIPAHNKNVENEEVEKAIRDRSLQQTQKSNIQNTFKTRDMKEDPRWLNIFRDFLGIEVK